MNRVADDEALATIGQFTNQALNLFDAVQFSTHGHGLTDAERTAITAYRRAVEAAAVGRLQESFDRLDRMGAVVACRFDEQAEKLAQEHLRLAEHGQSLVLVSQTWSEVRRVSCLLRDSPSFS